MFNIKITEKNQYFYLSVIVLIASAIRLFRLDFQSLWYDELHSIIPTNPIYDIASIIEYCKQDQPPTFFLLLHAWFKIVPYNEFWGRLFVALIGVLGIIAIFFLGKEIHSKTVGLFASGLTAINWFHIYFSQELRFYTLLFLLTTLSFLFFIRCYKKVSLPNYFFYSITTILLLYTHYYALVVLASHFVIFLILILFFGRREKNFIIFSLVSGILIVAAFSPWLPIVFSDNNTSSFWIKNPDIFFFFLYLYVYFGKDPYAFIAVAALSIIFLKYAFNVYKKNTAQDTSLKGVLAILILWAFLSYLIPYVYSVIAIPMLHERYTIIALPALFIIFSMGWSLVSNPKVRAIVAITIVISTLINFVFFNKYFTKVIKTQFRELATEVIQQNTNNVDLYSDGAWYFNYYFESLRSEKKVIHSSGINFEESLADNNAVWVLRSPSLEGVDAKNTQYLEANFEVVNNISYPGISATLYKRRQSL
jgi:uncharacterized membrane protein